MSSNRSTQFDLSVATADRGDMTLLKYLQRSGEVIPRDAIDEVHVSDDIELLGYFKEIVTYHWDRIEPEPNLECCCKLAVKYLLLCITRNPTSSDYLHSRYEAAAELSRLLKHWLNATDRNDGLLTFTVGQLTDLYLQSDSKTQLAIETGFLEHILEDAKATVVFKFWESNPKLQEAFREASKWGAAHRT